MYSYDKSPMIHWCYQPQTCYRLLFVSGEGLPLCQWLLWSADVHRLRTGLVSVRWPCSRGRLHRYICQVSSPYTTKIHVLLCWRSMSRCSTTELHLTHSPWSDSSRFPFSLSEWSLNIIQHYTIIIKQSVNSIIKIKIYFPSFSLIAPIHSDVFWGEIHLTTFCHAFEVDTLFCAMFMS